MQLPSGETINGVVPAGLSDDQVKSYVRMKRPDLFGAPGAAPGPPTTPQELQPNRSYTGEQLPAVGPSMNPKLMAAMPGAKMPPSVGGAITGAAGVMAGSLGQSVLAPAALPFLRKTTGWVAQNPIKAYITIQALKKVPGIGPLIEKTPGADLLPFLASEGKAPAQAAVRERLAPTAEASAPEPTPPRPTTNAEFGRQLDQPLRDAVGAPPPLQPNVPLKEQLPFLKSQPTMEPELAGHSAVESSAMKSYKYDPATQQFEIGTGSGRGYVYSDVSPEQAQAFQQAGSKGAAWQQLRNSPGVTYTHKIVNGKRIPVQPPRNDMDFISPDEWEAGHALGTQVEGSPIR